MHKNVINKNGIFIEKIPLILNKIREDLNSSKERTFRHLFYFSSFHENLLFHDIKERQKHEIANIVVIMLFDDIIK